MISRNLRGSFWSAAMTEIGTGAMLPDRAMKISARRA
jgi:hypothetical protein